MKKKVTIRDVAKECGFSIFTVSSVLNNRGNISQATSEKVLAAARKLDYNVLKNVSAVQRLRTRSIGIVLPSSHCLNDAFYNRAISKFRELSTAQDYDCKLFTEEDIIKRLKARHCDGSHSLGCKGLIIFCPNGNYAKYIEQLLKENVVLALIRRKHPERTGLLQINDDDYAENTRLIDYLHRDLDIKRMVYYSGRPLTRRNKGGRDLAFEDYIEKNQSVTDHMWLDGNVAEGSENRPALEAFIRQGLEQKERTAIICWTDADAVGMLGMANAVGLRIPDEICITGYNNDPHATISFPGITTMNIPVEEMVRDACRYLFDYIDESDLPRSRVIKFTHDLIVRESAGPKTAGATSNQANAT